MLTPMIDLLAFIVISAIAIVFLTIALAAIIRKIKLALTKLEIYDDKANRIANLIAVKYSFKFYNYLQKKKDFEPVIVKVNFYDKKMDIYESLQLPLGDKVYTSINL